MILIINIQKIARVGFLSDRGFFAFAQNDKGAGIYSSYSVNLEGAYATEGSHKAPFSLGILRFAQNDRREAGMILFPCHPRGRRPKDLFLQ